MTRGLQEILDKERRNRRPEEETPRSATDKRRRRSAGAAPNFIFCYLCGRQFGTASIDFHRPQCYLKKLIEWERGNPSLRGPKPVDPEAHAAQMKSHSASANAALPGQFNGGGKRGAAAGKRGNEIDAYNQLQMEAFNNTAMAPCPNCGRTFLPDRLQVHLRSCRPGNTAKPIRRGTAPVLASTGNGEGRPSTATPPPPPLQDALDSRPIKASGRYEVPAAAGADDVPPGAAEGRCSSAQGEWVSAPRQDQSCKVSAAAVPDGVTASSSTAAVVEVEVGRKSISNGDTRRVSIVVPKKAEDEDEEDEEARPPSPRAASEKRLSAAILTDDAEALGSSRPGRPASMEPVIATPRTASVSAAANVKEEETLATGGMTRNITGDRAVGSRPRKSPSPAVVASVGGLSESSGVVPSSVTAPESKVREKSDVCPPEECAVFEVHDDAEAVDAAEDAASAEKRIKLNNVSRFKNVQSRLKIERQSKEAVLTACMFCGRTFLPERIQRHEECCIDRNKPQSRPSPRKPRPNSSPAAMTTPRVKAKAASPSSSVPPNSTVKAASSRGNAPAPNSAATKFCGGCGSKVATGDQKFCTSCGHKL